MEKDPPRTSTERRTLTPASAGSEGGRLAPKSNPSEVAAFLAAARSIRPVMVGDGRIVFALDATMSRQPTWDLACRLQADMFDEVGKAGGLALQLVYFRGLSECSASSWVTDPSRLAGLMEKIDCRAGTTQIGRVLSHAASEAKAARIQALIFIGDAMEETPDTLYAKAGELALRKVACFMFHEGDDARTVATFREIARLTGGACIRFDRSAAAELALLLRAVATYAKGGRPALEQSGNRGARMLLSHMPRKGEGG